MIFNVANQLTQDCMQFVGVKFAEGFNKTEFKPLRHIFFTACLDWEQFNQPLVVCLQSFRLDTSGASWKHLDALVESVEEKSSSKIRQRFRIFSEVELYDRFNLCELIGECKDPGSSAKKYLALLGDFQNYVTVGTVQW